MAYPLGMMLTILVKFWIFRKRSIQVLLSRSTHYTGLFNRVFFSSQIKHKSWPIKSINKTACCLTNRTKQSWTNNVHLLVLNFLTCDLIHRDGWWETVSWVTNKCLFYANRMLGTDWPVQITKLSSILLHLFCKYNSQELGVRDQRSKLKV